MHLTPYLFKNEDKFAVSFSSKAKRQVLRADNSLDVLYEEETDDDIAYNEIIRLRSMGLPVEGTLTRGYLKTRVLYIWKQMQEGFKRGAWDFTSLLEEAAERGFTFNADYVAIDEINDLTPLQLKICAPSVGNKVVFAGDLDQCIYGWAGVDIEAIRGIEIDETEIRGESYRLTQENAAYADKIIQASDPIITSREGIPPEKRAALEPLVDWIRHDPKKYGHTMIIARTGAALEKARELAIEGKLNIARSDTDEDLSRLYNMIEKPPERFTSRDIGALTGLWLPGDEYWVRGGKKALKSRLTGDGELTLDQVLSYGTKKLKRMFSEIDKTVIEEYSYSKNAFNPALPRISFSTFHGSKGLEEDTVVVLTDSNERVESETDIHPEEERRLAYVAVTRAKKRLIVTSMDTQVQNRFI